jgi:hypothetical protein
MKQYFVAGLVAATMTACTFAPAMADTYVRGYTLPNGTYVAPHHRSSPDNSYNNNWSVQGNVNPYTGQQGTHAQRYEAPGGSLALPSLELPSLALPSLTLPSLDLD